MNKQNKTDKVIDGKRIAPEIEEKVKQEVKELKEKYGVTLGLALKDGFVSPNAGVDTSNAPEGHVVLLPKNPDKSAREIRLILEERYNCNIAVIIGDSRTHPLRWGCTGIAIGCSGIEAVEDERGKRDLFGKPLEITRKAVADNIVSAAQILMGECDESVPAVIMRDAPVEIKEVEGIPKMSPRECLYFGIFHNRID